tara:strand:+ start:1038 stop:1298 length:261 start_codon:yes stop_codon:yes gene_type:complete
MWNMKKSLLFAIALVTVILVSMNWASADEKKVTPKEFATAVSELPSKVGNHISMEIEKSKAYQKKSWAEAKKKWPWNKIFKDSNEQ